MLLERMGADSMLVSIIVPVFNASCYLPRCIDSIVNQTYRNIEIVLVDDGSTDDSGHICETYADKDSRICVIHQSNQGVSAARIVGLEHSIGESIMFVDADDFIDESTVSSLLIALNKDDADISVCQLFDVWDDRRIENIRPIRGTLKKDSFPGILSRNILFDKSEMRAGLTPYLCGKLFRRSVLNKSSLEIGRGIKYGEDMLVFLDIFKYHINCITIIDDCLYYYVHHSAQVTAQSVRLMWPNYVVVWEKLSHFDKEGYFSEQLPARIAFYLYKSAKKVLEEGCSRMDVLSFLKKIRRESIVNKLVFHNKSIYSLLKGNNYVLFLFLMKHRLYRCLYTGYIIKNKS